MDLEKIKEYRKNDYQKRKESKHRVPLELLNPQYESLKHQAEIESVSVAELIRKIITGYLESESARK